MKIKHTITRDECTLSGRILETIFEGDERRGDCNNIKIGMGHTVKSVGSPQLLEESLYVFGLHNEYDSRLVSYTYDSEQEAQAMLDAINSITIKEPTVPEEKWVYVSDESEEDALKCKEKRLLLADLGENMYPRYIATIGYYSTCWINWTYAVPVPPASVKKLREVMMTDEEYAEFTNQK